MDEYGSLEQEENGHKGKGTKENTVTDGSSELDDKRENAALMQEEERNTGSVSWSAYGKYLKFAVGLLWAPLLFGLLTAFQGADGECIVLQSKGLHWLKKRGFLVSNNLFLGFWTAGSINGFRQGDYMVVYASLGKIGSNLPDTIFVIQHFLRRCASCFLIYP